MMEALTALIALSQTALWHGLTVFLRVGPFVALLPGIGEQAIPARIKIVAAIAFTGLVAAALPDTAKPVHFEAFAWHILTEALSGLILGASVRLFLFGLQTAGTIAAQSTSLSQIFASPTADPQPAIGQFITLAGLTLAFIAGLHVKAVSFVILSYQLFPIGSLPGSSDTGEWAVDLVAQVMTLAFMLAMPFVVLSVLYNLTLGVINRAMPQLMVAFVGAPAITMGGLVLLMLLAPLMLDKWMEALDLHLATPLGPPR